MKKLLLIALISIPAILNGMEAAVKIEAVPTLSTTEIVLGRLFTLITEDKGFSQAIVSEYAKKRAELKKLTQDRIKKLDLVKENKTSMRNEELEGRVERWAITLPVLGKVTALGEMRVKYFASDKHTATNDTYKKDVEEVHEYAKTVLYTLNREYISLCVAAVGKDLMTPLHFAASGTIEAIKILLANKANPMAVDQNGWTPLHYACFRGTKEAVELLVPVTNISLYTEVNKVRSPLWCAVYHANKEAVEFLLDVDKDANSKVINTADSDGNTFLHSALGSKCGPAYSERIRQMKLAAAIAELLITRGAQINSKNKNGHAPLHLAIWHGHTETANNLIARGADLSAVDKNGWTPLHMAARFNNKEVMNALIKKGAVIRALTTDENLTARGLALKWDHRELAELLDTQDKKNNPNTTDNIILLWY